MRKIFLKVLAYFLGFKDRSYEELEKEGRQIRLNMINDAFKKKMKIDLIKEIYLIGSME